MLVLALDTTTRRGSVTLARDGVELESYSGDEGVTHGQRLPGDLVRVLDRQNLTVGDIDLFAVAAGPGSFTGLRIGIATMQGLALANAKPIIGISALDALYHASLLPLAPCPPPPRFALRRGSPKPGEGGSPLAPQPLPLRVATWMDAQRGEIFSALYENGAEIDGPSVERPEEVLARWSRRDEAGTMTFIGGGVGLYADLIRRALPSATLRAEAPMLALSIAQLAERRMQESDGLPDAIRPIYVRRPDAELAQAKKAAAK